MKIISKGIFFFQNIFSYADFQILHDHNDWSEYKNDIPT